MPHASCLMPHTRRHMPHATPIPNNTLRLEELLAQTSSRSSASSPTQRDRGRPRYPQAPARGINPRRDRSRSPLRPGPSQRRRSLSPLPRPTLSRRHAERTDHSPRRKHHRDPSPSSRNQSFRTGASQSNALAACTLCLGRHRHDISACTATTLWDGSPARCRRNEKGRLVNPNGFVICNDWQRPNGCSETTHDSRHECSGCGKPDHGAQRCPRAQKN